MTRALGTDPKPGTDPTTIGDQLIRLSGGDFTRFIRLSAAFGAGIAAPAPGVAEVEFQDSIAVVFIAAMLEAPSRVQ